MEKFSFFKRKGKDGSLSEVVEVVDAEARERIATLETNGGGTGGSTGTTEDSGEAAAYAEQAKESAEQAAASAEAAATSEANAADSAEAAEAAAGDATDEANRALACANEANAAAQVSGTDKTEAKASAEAAAAAETAAKAAQTAAEAYSLNAKDYADSASESKTAAANSASTAASKAQEAAGSAESATDAKTAAESAQSAAEDAQEAAETAASTATSKASAASTSASNAKTSETNAKTSETNAATSATNAASSASTATSKASAAATSATNAANSASAAADAATEAQEAAASIGGGYTVPDYWQSAVDAAITSVKAAQDAGGVECVTFAYFSDLHQQVSNPTMAAYTENIGNITAAVMDACNIPLCLMAGDTAENACPSTEAEPLADLEAAAEVLAPIGHERLMQIRGNHDDVYGSSGSTYYVNKIDQAKVWNRIFRAQAQDFRRVFGGDGSYFYIDNEPQKTRFICLNSYFYGGEPITDGTTYGMNAGYGAAQLEWLANEALPTDREGWSVVIASHTPPATINGTDYFSQLWDGALFVGIVTAYRTKTSYSGTYPSSTDWKNASVSVNYADSEVADVIGIFCGHCHYDEALTDALPCPVVSITSATNLTYDTNEGTRTQGTANETAVDFVCVNKAAKTVSLVRLGIGSNRAFSYDGTKVLYSVTSNLTNVTSSNAATSATEGDAYSATLTAASGYELSSVTVTMGGADVTGSAYSGGVVSIASVTGDIVITATAEAAAPSYTNQIPISTDASGAAYNGGAGWKTGYRLNSSGAEAAASGQEVTGFIPVTSGDVLRFANMALSKSTNASQNYISAYQSDKSKVVWSWNASTAATNFGSNAVWNSDGTLSQLTLASSITNAEYIAYLRFSANEITDSSIITKNEPIE